MTTQSRQGEGSGEAGRTALITGGTGGLGTAVTELFLADGWRVTLPYVHAGQVDDLRERPFAAPAGDRLVTVHADLFEQSSALECVAAATQTAGAPLRAVINLVGGFAAGGRVHETPIDDFEAQFRANLRPTYLVSSASLPHLLDAGEGAIVCVSTRAALRPFPGAAGYIASKAAVLALVDALAAEYTADGVRTNAVLPSVIDTLDNRASQPDADHSRWVKPQEIARVIRFLCSDDSAPTSGAHVPVYGRA
jgi:NAD(P)-dependent dehydrogenase (short-subunit alcohol dehydrogenase family)